jgi:hypothetical protein
MIAVTVRDQIWKELQRKTSISLEYKKTLILALIPVCLPSCLLQLLLHLIGSQRFTICEGLEPGSLEFWPKSILEWIMVLLTNLKFVTSLATGQLNLRFISFRFFISAGGNGPVFRYNAWTIYGEWPSICTPNRLLRHISQPCEDEQCTTDNSHSNG